MIAVPNSHLSETVYRKELMAFYSFCLFVHDGTRPTCQIIEFYLILQLVDSGGEGGERKLILDHDSPAIELPL